MRNLKKILALVLALVMSLSLMMTASAATEFKDDESIDATYRLAVEVLNGLEVLKGDDNGFRPEGYITRAEVAAILYRVTTGDVTDARVNNFTPYGQFSDVNAGSWYAGYVTYSANAGYIKGNGDGTFKPNNNVTGYEVLAMILRSVGYDKQTNEFTGPDWQLHVASTAQQKHILDNCQGVALGEPAKRQEVAEMIFRAILLPKVTYSTATLSYSDSSERVADVLGLEAVTGVVIANEWAALDGDAPLAAGKTKLKTADGVETLDWSTGLPDIGESHTAYIQNSTTVINWADTTDEPFDNQGVRTDIDGHGKFKAATGVDYNDDTEWYQNFDLAKEVTSDYRIEYSVSFRKSMVGTANDPYTFFGRTAAQLEALMGAGEDDFADEYTTYVKIIKAGDVISEEDQAVMKLIFGRVDDDPIVDPGDPSAAPAVPASITKHPTSGVCGYVFTGTNSNSSVNRNIDRSDEMSYSQFEEEYLKPGNEIAITKAENGEWLKVIDNDGDGYADYVLLTDSHLDQVNRVTTKDDTTTYQFYNVDTTQEIRYLKDGEIVDSLDLAQNEKVLWSYIDGIYYMESANVETGSVQKVNYGTASIGDNYYLDSVDTTDGISYKQSGIDNETRLDKWLRNASRDIEYYFYADHFGTIRAFEPVNGTQYALLTEAYSRNTDNGRYLLNWVGTVEHKIGSSAIANATVDNFNGNKEEGNIFFNKEFAVPVGAGLYDILQPATKNLDAGTTGIHAITEDEMNWGTAANPVYSATNVAAYTKSSDGQINIESVARQATDDDHNPLYRQADRTIGTTPTANPLWDSNYLQLDVQKMTGAMYKISGSTEYVHASYDTEYYVVGSSIRYFTSYKNLSDINAEYIDVVYAVAHNDYGTSSSDLRDYWVADVVVIELNDQYTTAYDDVVLVTHNQNKWRAASNMYTLTGISAATGKPVEFLVDSSQWTNTMTSSVPFFVGTRAVSEEDGMEVREISEPFYADAEDADLDFSENGIRVGRINVVPGQPNNGYVNVLVNDDPDQQFALDISNVYHATRASIDEYIITDDYVVGRDIQTYGNEGDLVLWANKPGSSNVSFVVMVSIRNENTGRYFWAWDNTACTSADLNEDGNPIINSGKNGLTNLWDDVYDDAVNVSTATTTVKFYGVEDKTSSTDTNPAAVGDLSNEAGTIKVSWTQAHSGEPIFTVTNGTYAISANTNNETNPKYTAIVTTASGAKVTYALEVAAAGTNTNIKDVTCSGSCGLQLHEGEEGSGVYLLVIDWLNKNIPADPTSTATYTLMTLGAKRILANYKDGRVTIEGANAAADGNISMEQIVSAVVNVTAENGKTEGHSASAEDAPESGYLNLETFAEEVAIPLYGVDGNVPTAMKLPGVEDVFTKAYQDMNKALEAGTNQATLNDMYDQAVEDVREAVVAALKHEATTLVNRLIKEEQMWPAVGDDGEVKSDTGVGDFVRQFYDLMNYNKSMSEGVEEATIAELCGAWNRFAYKIWNTYNTKDGEEAQRAAEAVEFAKYKAQVGTGLADEARRTDLANWKASWTNNFDSSKRDAAESAGTYNRDNPYYQYRG